MWEYGYTDPFSAENDTIEVFWGEASSFVTALGELCENVEKMLNDAEPYQISHYEQVLAEIRTILSDPAYAEDPDQWEDMEFTDDIGEIVYYLIEL